MNINCGESFEGSYRFIVDGEIRFVKLIDHVLQYYTETNSDPIHGCCLGLSFSVKRLIIFIRNI